MKKLALFLAIVVAVVVFLSILIPSKPGISGRDPINVSMMHAIGLAKACRSYALQNGGKPPPTLSAQEFVAEFGADAWNESLYHDPESGKRMEWLYFPPEKVADIGREDVFMASPIASKKGQRIVVFGDCSARIMKSGEFEAIYPIAQSLRAQ